MEPITSHQKPARGRRKATGVLISFRIEPDLLERINKRAAMILGNQTITLAEAISTTLDYLLQFEQDFAVGEILGGARGMRVAIRQLHEAALALQTERENHSRGRQELKDDLAKMRSMLSRLLLERKTLDKAADALPDVLASIRLAADNSKNASADILAFITALSKEL